jgi:hypothetical protein
VEELEQIEGSIMALDKSKKKEITEAYQQVLNFAIVTFSNSN